MNKKIVIVIASIFLTWTILISCDSSSKKVEDARENVQTTTDNAAIASQDLNKAIQDSTDQYQKFKKESESRINYYEKIIADLKTKIDKEKKDGKTEYQKMVAGLEQKTTELRKNLNDYKKAGKDDWESFKIKFNHNMDDLGNSISNFFSNDKKY